MWKLEAPAPRPALKLNVGPVPLSMDYERNTRPGKQNPSRDYLAAVMNNGVESFSPTVGNLIGNTHLTQVGPVAKEATLI